MITECNHNTPQTLCYECGMANEIERLTIELAEEREKVRWCLEHKAHTCRDFLEFVVEETPEGTDLWTSVDVIKGNVEDAVVRAKNLIFVRVDGEARK